jgi:CshA-type fibril repeat protein
VSLLGFAKKSLRKKGLIALAVAAAQLAVSFSPLAIVPAAHAVTSAFPCDSSLYQVSGGSFYKYSPATGLFTQVGTANVASLNGIGYNPADNYIYGSTNGTTLYKIDNAGAITSVGSVTGSVQTSGGDFIHNDYMVTVGSGLSLVQLARAGGVGTAVTGAASTAITLTNANANAGTANAFSSSKDITIVKDAVGSGYTGYALEAAKLYIFSFASSTPTTASYITKTVNYPSAANDTTGTYGAQYSDSAGNLFFYNNNVASGTSHHMFELANIDRAAITSSSANPTLSLLTTTSVNGSMNDGASCRTAQSAFAPSVTTTNAATGVTTSAATVGGTVTPYTFSSAAVTSVKICYNTTGTVDASGATAGLLTGGNCVNATPNTLAASATSSNVSVNFSGLSSGTQYYYQVQATNTAALVGYGAVYNFTTTSGPSLSIVANAASYTIGGLVPSLSGTTTGSGGGTLAGSLTCNVYHSSDTNHTSIDAIDGLSVGTYVVWCDGTPSVTSPATSVTRTAATFTVVASGAIPVDITAHSASYRAGTTAPTLSGDTSDQTGLPRASLICNAYGVADTGYNSIDTIDSNTPAGTYVIHCSGNVTGGSFALGSNTNGVLTILAKIAVTITPVDVTFVHGNNPPAFTGAADPSAGISGSLTCHVYDNNDNNHTVPLTIASTTPVGIYTIFCGTGFTVAAGYVLTNNEGTLNVTDLPLVGISGDDSSYTVGGALPVIGGHSDPSNGVTGALTCNVYDNADTGYVTILTIGPSTRIGTYAIHCAGTLASGFQAGANADGVLTVVAASAPSAPSLPAAPTITVPPASTIGTTPVTLTPSITAPGGIGNRCLVDPADHVCKATVTLPGKGTFVLNSNGTVTFSAVLGFTGTATVQYRVTDSEGQSAETPVTVTVNAPAAPTVTGGSGTTITTVPANVTPLVTGIGSICLIDPADNGCKQTVTIPGKGTFVLNSNGTVTFTAASGFIGTVTVQLQITTAYGQVARGPVTFIVGPTSQLQTGATTGTTPVNLAPTTKPEPGSACLVDPTDDGCKNVVTIPEVGTWNLNPSTGAVTFKAVSGYVGTTIVQYRIKRAGFDPTMTPFVVTVAPKRAPVTVTIGGFNPGSPILTAPIKNQIAAFMKAYVGYKSLECIGFTMGPTVLSVDKWLSTTRASNACDFILNTLKSKVSALPLKNKMETNLGAHIRRITLTLRD